jgi:hypothetical protein
MNVFKRDNLAKKMFWVFVGMVCGIVIAQEVPNLPRLRTKFEALYAKYTGDDPSPPTNSE